MVSQSIFKPNAIEMPSAHLVSESRLDTLAPAVIDPVIHDRAALLPTDTEAIRLQLKTVQILNGLQAGFLGLTPPKGVYVISSVVDGISDQPITFEGRVYQGIKNGDVLPFGTEGERDAPFTIYLREGGMPRVLCFSLVVLRSNENLRQIGNVFAAVMADNRYTSLSDIITTAVTATVPAFGVIWQAANEVIGLIGNYLKSKPDDQLGYYEARYTNQFDNLGMGKHPPQGEGKTIPVNDIRLAYQIDVV